MMTHETINGKPVHSAAKMYAEEFKAGLLDRREFLTRASALGVATSAIYTMGGLTQPAHAAAHAKQGGTIRMQMEVRALKDPRTWDWTQIAFVGNGWLEYLIEYNSDGSFNGWLAESWEVNEDATQYTFNIRKGVKWNNGDELTAEHIAFNFNRWAEGEAEGNSMAARVDAIVDPETKKAIDGAIEVVDSHTLRLNLRQPDITLIPGIADYPAAITHPDDNMEDLLEKQIGTGAYKNDMHEVGVKSVLVRNEGHDWWGYAEGKGAFLDRIEFIDYGTDPSAWVAAAESEEIDTIYENVGDFVSVFDSIGWNKSELATGSTIVIRPNQAATDADGKVVLLELGNASQGVPADNCHVGPVHPEHDASVTRLPHDPAKALALLTEAGMADYEFELHSIDDDWRKNTTDAVAAQMRDAGMKVKRTILPGSTFWNDWTKYAFSSTNWNHRPLGTQVLGLAYKSGVAWNEFAWSNEEFDGLLDQANAIADAGKRREVMSKIQAIVIEEGVTIQPYWRSIYRHTRPGFVGTDMHIAYASQLYKWAVEA
jgi:peptide/nickel transport system substrate-binding protein